MIHKSITSIFFTLLVLIGTTQSKYTSFSKVSNDYNISTQSGESIIMKGDIYNNDDFQYLNDDDEYLNSYPSRYDYLIGESHHKLDYYKSTIVVGDTSSRSYKGFYLDIHPSYLSDRVIPISYISKSFITNRDWNKFQEYVRDSITYRILAENIDTEKFLIPTYIRNAEENRLQDSYEWLINWKAKINYKKQQSNEQFLYMSMLYYPPSERFRKHVEIDARKLHYRYYEVQNKTIAENSLKNFLSMHEEYDSLKARNTLWNDYYRDYYDFQHTPLFVDSTLWKIQSKTLHHGDITDQLVSHYASSEDYLGAPVMGITSMQAKAYLHWLQTEHQKLLNNKKSWYYVEYNLPTALEISKSPEHNSVVTVPGFDLTPWQITNREYKQFVEYATDSVMLQIASYHYGPEGFRIPTYDDYMEEMDEYEWLIDWRQRKKLRTKPMYVELMRDEGLFYPYNLIDSNNSFDIDYRKIEYEFYNYNFQTASRLGELESVNEDYEDCDRDKYHTKTLSDSYYEEYKNGKNLRLSSTNNSCQNADVRSHEDRSPFIERTVISIYPGIHCYTNKISSSIDEETGNRIEKYCNKKSFEDKRLPEYDFDNAPNEAISNITYAQAFAFYNWKQKQQGYVVKNSSKIIANYIPSESEWAAIQKGESIKHPKEVYQYPTPISKYVVRFYPRNEISKIPALSTVSQHLRLPGAKYNSNANERKNFLKKIDSDLSMLDEASNIQIIRNKKTKLWGMYSNDRSIREIVPQYFTKIVFLKDSLVDFAECYNDKGQKTCINLIDYDRHPKVLKYFDEIEYRSDLYNGYQVLVRKNKKWGVLNPSNGQLIYACQETHKPFIPVFSADGLNYLWNYINARKAQGDISFLPDGNGDGVFYAQNKDKKWGLYQMERALIPAQYDKIETIGYNTPFTIVWNNGKAGVWQGMFSSGKETIPCKYDDAKRFKTNGYYFLAVKSEGKWGYVDWYNGEVLLELKYDSFEELPGVADYKSSYYR